LSKYKAKTKVIDCIKFDSIIEADYYERLKKDVADGKILNFDLQPVFELQRKFEMNDKKYQAINYKADFRVYLNNGLIDVIDIKGMATPEAKLKRKMYNYKYLVPVKWIVWYQSQWMDYDKALKIKRERKKARLLKL